MRIDFISIFPEYFEPLRLSLLGQASDHGILDLRFHQLRDFTHDIHRSVDDTPAGGGPGMVMLPEPWAQALESLPSVGEQPALIVFTTPAGHVFTQSRARKMAQREHLVFCCGRFEGFDQRVVEYARRLGEVVELSIGDYVLNGGEAAAMVMTEAIARLIPGVIGNPDSLMEESHNQGLIEHPAYTKPALWRDMEVPAVLLSGDHAKVDAWRREQSLARTAAMRPDLLSPAPARSEAPSGTAASEGTTAPGGTADREDA